MIGSSLHCKVFILVTNSAFQLNSFNSDIRDASHCDQNVRRLVIRLLYSPSALAVAIISNKNDHALRSATPPFELDWELTTVILYPITNYFKDVSFTQCALWSLLRGLKSLKYCSLVCPSSFLITSVVNSFMVIAMFKAQYCVTCGGAIQNAMLVGSTVNLKKEW